MVEKLLTVSNLRTHFYTYEGVVKALDGVDFEVNRREVMGLVGETGCCKSVTALSIMRLIAWPPGKIVDGEIIFKGENLFKKEESEMRKIRGDAISMIFQEPATALNPVFKVGNLIAEVIREHQQVTKEEAMKKAIEMIGLTKIPDPQLSAHKYPHELSGGMKQRIMIAMAISCNPLLLIADEPTTFLDVTVEAQILQLMKELRGKINASMLLITHNMGVVATTCNRVAMMYAGKIVEEGKVEDIFKDPRHPYTIGLLNSIPKLTEKREKLEVIKGSVPNPINPPSGCRFHPRCLNAKAICIQQAPKPVEVGDMHKVSCFISV